MLFNMLVIVMVNTLGNRSKRFDFTIIKQFLDSECSITLETLDYNKIWISSKRSHPCTITLIAKKKYLELYFYVRKPVRCLHIYQYLYCLHC